MTIDDVIAFAYERISLEISKDEQSLQVEIQKIKSDLAGRGMSRSGVCIELIHQACARAATRRVSAAWSVLHRGVTTVGIEFNEELESKLFSVIESFFPEDMGALTVHAIEAARISGVKNYSKLEFSDIKTARLQGVAEAASEIKLFVLSLKTKPVKVAYSPGVSIRNSTIGALQIEEQSVVNVQQQIGAESRDLINALDVVSRVLAMIPNVSGHNKAEIVELVEEGKSELDKEAPSRAKMGSYLATIGGALKAVSELKPVYETLKAAAVTLGYQLP